MDRVTHLGVKGLLDLLGGGDLHGFGTRKKRLQKGPFLLQRHVFMATPTGAGRFNSRQPHAVVGGNDAAHRGDGYPGVFGNLFGFARGNERIIDNPPAVSHPKARIQFHATFDFFQRKMSCGSCDSASHSPDSLLCFMVLYYTTWNANWYQFIFIQEVTFGMPAPEE